jgi:hypothetical protein
MNMSECYYADLTAIEINGVPVPTIGMDKPPEKKPITKEDCKPLPGGIEGLKTTTMDQLSRHQECIKIYGGESAPTEKSRQSDTPCGLQNKDKDVARPLQSTRNDLETRMGRVAERDDCYNMYYSARQLDRTTPGWRKPPPGGPSVAASKQVQVDGKLTAEEVFAVNQKDELHILGPLFFRTSACKENCIDTRKLSESEGLRLKGLTRIHEMAALTLYNERCGNQPLAPSSPSTSPLGLAFSADDKAAAAAIIVSQFRRLPQEVQERALDHEVKAIESVRDSYNNSWQWFCRKMNDDINKGYVDHMFMTAKEGFFPIEEN